MHTKRDGMVELAEGSAKVRNCSLPDIHIASKASCILHPGPQHPPFPVRAATAPPVQVRRSSLLRRDRRATWAGVIPAVEITSLPCANDAGGTFIVSPQSDSASTHHHTC